MFDHYIFYESWARAHDGIPRLMYSNLLPNKETIFIWDTYRYDFPAQKMNCIITIERSNQWGEVFNRVHCPLSFSWIYPEQVRQLAAAVGFDVETVYGDFSCNELNENSPEQVWLLRRPQN